MDKELAELIILRVATFSTLVATIFVIRKANQHIKLLGIKETKLRGKSFFNLYFSLSLFFEFFYVIIPYFLKYDRTKSEEELTLENKIGQSVTIFWFCIGISLLFATLGMAAINKYL